MSDPFQRDLLRGSWDLMILSVLAGGKKYGYLIQKELRDVSQGRAELQAGTLYPILHRLEQEKLIRSFWDDESGRKRKWYQLTAAGQKRLCGLHLATAHTGRSGAGRHLKFPFMVTQHRNHDSPRL
jgi:PadR family transcriptional regulator, regulatory protein PadR